jgi:DNA-binding response OmpR family regulator
MALKFLIADHSPTMRNIFINLLKELKETDVVEAKDGLHVLTESIENKPDIIILNLHISKKSGLDIIPSLMKRAKPYIAVIVNKIDKESTLALELGARRLLIKPFDKRGLEMVLKQMILEVKMLKEKHEKTENEA